MNTQEKFTVALATLAKRHRLELINDRGYINTGTLRVQRIGDFSDVLTINYNFQDGAATLTARAAGLMHIHTFRCAEPSQLQEVLDACGHALSMGAPYYSGED